MMSIGKKQDSCYICGSHDLFKRHSSCRDRQDVYPVECRNCGLVFLSSFEHITAQFYENSGMRQPLPVRPTVLDKQALRDTERRFHELHAMIDGKTVLDFGCGSGAWMERAADVAQSVFGVEPEAAMHQRSRGGGGQIFTSLETVDPELRFDVITLFHVLEHLPDPRDTLRRLSSLLKPDGFIWLEVPNASDALFTLYENEAFRDFSYWGCHLFLFTESTLVTLMAQAGYAVVKQWQTQRYPLSNHLYWLAKGRPGGHEQWSDFNTPALERAYAECLAARQACDTVTGFFRITEV